MPVHQRYRDLIRASGAALLTGALLAALDGRGSPLIGWLVYSLFAGLGLAGYLWAGRLFAAPAAVRHAALSAWAMRIIVGVLLMLLLPRLGNPNEPSQAGYLFSDAYRRDTQAWELAQSGQPLLQAFSGGYSGDQYGGVLALYASVYRYISPDVHRPFLILLIGAAAAIWGVLALGAAADTWFGSGPAAGAAWILALYPEGLFLSASHMREALVIPLSALAWYGLIPLQQKSRFGWLVSTGSLAALLLIQPAVAVFVIIVLAGLWMLGSAGSISWRRLALLAVLLVVALAIVFSVWASLPSLQGARGLDVITKWLESNFNVQVYQTERKSGVMQAILGDIGVWAKGAAVTAYGVFRPVLPAALISPGASVMRVIESLRGLGWYLLAPLLLYGAWLTLRLEKTAPRRPQLIWLALAIWGWVVLASANAGGDQWDNPRYRAMFLVFQALFAAWAWQVIRQRRARWFWRFAAIEAVFVILFTFWYVTRVYVAVPDVHIYVIGALFALCSLGIVGWGILTDRRA